MIRPHYNPCFLSFVSPQSSSVFGHNHYQHARGYLHLTACRCERHSSVWKPPIHYAFHSSRRVLHDGSPGPSNQTHYETLNVPISASTADIKKSFYKLSKLHHPDHNPKDPHAPRRFMRISEAYAVLGHTEKRAIYDRDVARHHQHLQHHRHHGHPRPNASYHSTGPAGGRPASGLSRRHGIFRGPPPSFYRNTGPGKATPGGAESGGGGASTSGTTSNAHSHRHQHPGFGPGNVNSDDTGTRSHPDTPHFNWDSTERTHRNIDERTAQRRAASSQLAGADAEASMVLGFLVISAALIAGVLVPAAYFSSRRDDGGQRQRKVVKTGRPD